MEQDKNQLLIYRQGNGANQVAQEDQTAAVDSLRLFIIQEVVTLPKRHHQQQANPMVPATSLQITDPRLTSKVVSLYEDTGEIHSVRPEQALIHEHYGAETTYKRVKWLNGPQLLTGISVGISAKALSSNYLQGITPDTLGQLYQEIISQGIITVSEQDFNNARVAYADLKTDIQVQDTQAVFKTIQANLNDDIYQVFKSKEAGKMPIHGITVGHRNASYRFSPNQAYLAYLKIYDKGQELKTQSSVFNEKHLHFNCPENLIRTEITLSRDQLLHYFKDYQDTLFSLVQQVQQDGLQVLFNILFSGYYFKATPTAITVSAVSPENLSKQEEQVVAIVELCLTSQVQFSLPQVQEKVLQILKPGINRTPTVKRLTERHYTRLMEDPRPAEELLQTLRMD